MTKNTKKTRIYSIASKNIFFIVFKIRKKSFKIEIGFKLSNL